MSKPHIYVDKEGKIILKLISRARLHKLFSLSESFNYKVINVFPMEECDSFKAIVEIRGDYKGDMLLREALKTADIIRKELEI